MTRVIFVKPGTVATAEIERLRDSGVIVVEHSAPEELTPLLEQNADCCLESVIARLVAEVVRQVGPNYTVTVEGSVTAESLMRSTGNGPPINEEGVTQTVTGHRWHYKNSDTVKCWVFATSHPFWLDSSSPTPPMQYGLSNPAGIAYLLAPGQSITLKWTGSPPTISTRGLLPGE
jgi:hypothetical protein